MMEVTGAFELAADMGAAAKEAAVAVAHVTIAVGAELREEWRANARKTSGKHGKWYPSSITSSGVSGGGPAEITPAGISVDIGPDKARKQGAMGPGFEYGSVHQPPHLDGTKAVEAIEPKFLSEIELAAKGLL